MNRGEWIPLDVAIELAWNGAEARAMRRTEAERRALTRHWVRRIIRNLVWVRWRGAVGESRVRIEELEPVT